MPSLYQSLIKSGLRILDITARFFFYFSVAALNDTRQQSSSFLHVSKQLRMSTSIVLEQVELVLVILSLKITRTSQVALDR